MKSMKNKTRIVIGALAVATLVSFISGGVKLDKFGSSIEKVVGPKTIRVPYTDVISYMGYAQPGSEEAVVDGKKFNFIYVWVPAVAPELGVRMLSPTAGLKIKGAVQSADFAAHAGDADFFDTYITLEKSSITSAGDISESNVKSAKWTVLDRNDDSSEMPKQPSGSSYNSLLRYKSDASNPLKALSKGLYRIGFTTYKKGEVKGTFLAEVAAPVKLPGVVMAKDLNEVIKAVK